VYVSKRISEAAAFRFKFLLALAAVRVTRENKLYPDRPHSPLTGQRVLLTANPVTRQADILIIPLQQGCGKP
jgi:hypothetical protein